MIESIRKILSINNVKYDKYVIGYTLMGIESIYAADRALQKICQKKNIKFKIL